MANPETLTNRIAAYRARIRDLSEQRRQVILELHANAMSMAEISRRTGISYQRVQKILATK